MNRLLLRALNAPLFVLMALLAVAIQSSLFKSWPITLLQPDFVLIAVIWCGLKRPFVESALLTLIFAHIAEIHSSAPAGALMICYVGVLLLSRAALKVFVLPGRRAAVLLTLACSFGWKLLFLSLLYLLDLSDNQWRHTLSMMLPNAVMAGASAWFLFPWLERFDVWSWKSERIRKSVEGDLLLSEDGDDL